MGMTITAAQARTFHEMLRGENQSITLIEQDEQDGSIILQRDRARFRIQAGGSTFRLAPTWMSSSDEEEASMNAWAKLSNGSILMDLEAEELYVVYCQVREAAMHYGVAI